jgi:ubiquinone/menaquinone biosynthesis C-methylase UbiE
MDTSPDLLEKIRQQFDFGPYPRIPIEQSPKEDANLLLVHSLVTPYYLKYQRVIDTKSKVILDAGCGSGYKSLILAEANPGAKIVGVDLSEGSIKLARERLKFHNFEQVEFHALTIENLPSLGMQFDYINCDEVLYLLPDPVAGLKAFQSVLKPEGIIRANLHSSLQRSHFYRAQAVFQFMGLMDDNPEDLEMSLLREVMQALKDSVDLKASTWNPAYEAKNADEVLMTNFLLQGDKGFTVPQLFNDLHQAELDLISMVNWREWGLMDLFRDPNNLPAFLAMSLPEMSLEDQLRLYELLHPIHRLLDFWCCHSDAPIASSPISEWQDQDWENALIYLNPQLSTLKVKQQFTDSLTAQKPLDMYPLLSLTALGPTLIDTATVALLLFLMEGPQSIASLREHWLKLQPLDLISLQPVTSEQAQATLVRLLSRLEIFLYVLIDRQS